MPRWVHTMSRYFDRFLHWFFDASPTHVGDLTEPSRRESMQSPAGAGSAVRLEPTHTRSGDSAPSRRG